jgi:hypothetical protein
MGRLTRGVACCSPDDDPEEVGHKERKKIVRGSIKSGLSDPAGSFRDMYKNETAAPIIMSQTSPYTKYILDIAFLHIARLHSQKSV